MASRDQAITAAKAMRKTHVEWLEHLRPSGLIPGQPHCDRCAREGIEQVVGDAAHHEARIADYDNILAVLRKEGEEESWLETIETSVEAALEQLREEQLTYLDSLTFDGTASQDYRNGWSDCREDVERSFAVLGDKEERS